MEAPESYEKLGDWAIRHGETSLAVDLLLAGWERYPKHARLAYLAGLALSNAGSLGNASEILDGVLPQLSAGNELLCDALSLRGRIAKEQWARNPDTVAGEAALVDSAAYYLHAYEVSGSPYPAVNAASLSRLLGDRARSDELARQVIDLCITSKASQGEVSHWTYATLGEAHLLLGEERDAVREYSVAVEMAGDRIGDVVAMRRQVQRLEGALEVPEALHCVLDVGTVVVFTGHLIDRPERRAPRFPSELEGAARREIRKAVESLNARFGYCSLAAGGDILFFEEMERRSAEINVFLPFGSESFRETCVEWAGSGWGDRFARALASSEDRVQLTVKDEKA
ncbi:TRAFs-binding domain-containing protein [Gemmatimonadota bacterium]